jgi:hypothetical protein
LIFHITGDTTVTAPASSDLARRRALNWTGIGHVVTGMARYAYDLELTR